MKLHKLISLLTMSIGVGAAMSVALKDVSTGIAIGTALSIAFLYGNSNNCTESK